MHQNIQDKRLGCYWGQCVGDALGSLVEFKTKETIARSYPDGISELIASPVFPVAEKGQLTDDSEMAIALLNSMHDPQGAFIGYDSQQAMQHYRAWFDSHPIDCGMTIGGAIRGYPNPSSESNGALMRASGLAVMSHRLDEVTAAKWAREDAEVTHPNVVCHHANQLFVLLIRHLLLTDVADSDALHSKAQNFVAEFGLDSVSDIVVQARHKNLTDFYTNMGWVRIALHNALFHLFNETPWRTAVHETVMQGGDTDTTAAIVGALLGARDGVSAIPSDWLHDVQACTPARRPSALHAINGARLLERCE
ncbi:ADP-ribosylglycohydrolase family protein [Pseudidiomarina sp.]|uniref:ADP-ribosylglycohydrolase family protein n=1 Tax=Pseudidiomarina sp. TaxID=2081707 RepID=UPI003A97F4E2